MGGDDNTLSTCSLVKTKNVLYPHSIIVQASYDKPNFRKVVGRSNARFEIKADILSFG